MAKMCMKFNFIPICTYLCGVFHIYCSCLTTLDPMSLGTICTWICFRYIGDALEALSHLQWRCCHHVLIVFKLEWLWTLIFYITQCYLGNKFLSHAYFSSFQPCVGCFMAWAPFCYNSFGSCKTSLLKMWVSQDDYISRGIYIIIFMIHQSQIC